MNSSKVKEKLTLAGLLVALGIIYGDIGTSPLYVLKAILGVHPITPDLVMGGVSCVFWTLVFQTTFKYIILTLKADNHGEGGIFSLYALVKRYGKWLAIPTILGATTLLADGIITPPISVASAIEGLTMIPGLQQLPTVPIVIIILSLLFIFQRFGTQNVGKTFGPIMLVWFSMLFILGIRYIVLYPSILQSLNPYYAYQLLVHFPGGFWLLGAVFLATTGAEALYSDLGHCGRQNIRISWVFVKICLMINYMGQAAWVLYTNTKYLSGKNPFYEIMPSWFLLPGILIATAAAIIASQALISGSYTLINEAMNLNFWPRISVRQPTETKGQIYIPSVNTILWIGCIMMILYFKESAHMEAAYGFSITIAMMMTTILLTFYLLYYLKWNKYAVFFLVLLFSIIEFSFFVANVAKIKERWMFLFFELGIFIVMYIWFYARKINNRLLKFTELGKYVPLLKELSNDEKIPKYCTHLVYLTKANNKHEIEEKIIKSIFAKHPKRADVYWFLHIDRTDHPYTHTYNIHELADNKIIKVNIHLGFRNYPKTEVYFRKIVKELEESQEININFKSGESTKYNPEPDFKFVIIEKFLSVENEFTFKSGILLHTYFFLKKMALSDIRAFGLEKTDVVKEEIPIVFNPIKNLELERVE